VVNCNHHHRRHWSGRQRDHHPRRPPLIDRWIDRSRSCSSVDHLAIEIPPATNRTSPRCWGPDGRNPRGSAWIWDRRWRSHESSRGLPGPELQRCVVVGNEGPSCGSFRKSPLHQRDTDRGPIGVSSQTMGVVRCLPALPAATTVRPRGRWNTDIIVDHRSVVVVLPLVPFPNDGR